MPRQKEGEHNFPLRLPDKMYQLIAEEADENERSINAEIITLLKEALEARKPGTYPKENRLSVSKQTQAA